MRSNPRKTVMSDGVAVCVLNIHVDARKNKTIDRLS